MIAEHYPSARVVTAQLISTNYTNHLTSTIQAPGMQLSVTWEQGNGYLVLMQQVSC